MEVGGIVAPRPGVTGNWLRAAGHGNTTWVLCEESMCSQLLRHLIFQALLLHFFLDFFMQMSILSACMSVLPYVCSAHKGQKRALDPLELELQI